MWAAGDAGHKVQHSRTCDDQHVMHDRKKHMVSNAQVEVQEQDMQAAGDTGAGTSLLATQLHAVACITLLQSLLQSGGHPVTPTQTQHMNKHQLTSGYQIDSKANLHLALCSLTILASIPFWRITVHPFLAHQRPHLTLCRLTVLRHKHILGCTAQQRVRPR